MNTQSLIDTAIRLIPLDQLYLHDMNPRQNGSASDAAAMAQSIAVNGLMQNLMGYADPDRDGEIGIVAGGRRLSALLHLKTEGSSLMDSKEPDWDAIPVQVTDDPLLACSWAGAESATQKPLHPADEIRAYADLAKQGIDANMIARTFAQTERHVKGRLALASLIPEALDALRGGHISLDVAKALTLARDDDAQMSMLTTARSGQWTAQRLRNALTEETVRSDDRKVRFIGLIRYQAEGGTLDNDLFEEQAYLHDRALVDRLFTEKLATEAEAMRAEQGWSWVKTTENHYQEYGLTDGLVQVYRAQCELPEADAAEYKTLADQHDTLDEKGVARIKELRARKDGDYSDQDREAGGIVALVNRDGKLTIDGAFVKKGKASRNTDSSSAGTSTPAKPALTQAGAEDLRRIGLMALQGAMVDKTEFLLDLFGWQIERGAPSYSSPFAIVLTDQSIKPDADGSWHMDPRLADPAPSEQDYNEDTATTFAEFQAKGKKHRNQVIARGLTRALQIPDGRMAALGSAMADFAGVNIRKAWTPDAPTYFSRLSSPAMETLWAELLEADASDDRVTAFGKLKKAQKAKDLADLFENAAVQEAHGLSRAQIATIDAWLPPELRAD